MREHDLTLFLRAVDHRDRALMARQRRYFRNLVQLPLARFDYRVDSDQWDGHADPVAVGTTTCASRRSG